MYEATQPPQNETFAPPPLPSEARPASRRADILAIALLIILPTLYFGDVIAGVSNFYMRDLTRYYYPTKQIYREIVLHGEFPYWNRYFSAGQPIAANPEHEIFYPLTWLILLPSYDFGYRLHILVHIYIGLLGMYALLRSMDLSPPAAAFGAISFGLGGLYLSYINLLPILFCAAWLPLTCLFARRFLIGYRARDFALASLSLGMQFIVAEPTTIMQTGVLIGMYALYRGWHSERRIRGMAVNVLWIALISASALAVGAAQMLPAIDHVADSARSRPFGFDLVKAWSMPWAKLVELFYPNILGHISIDRVMWYWGGGLYPGMGSPFLFSIYPGLAMTALAIGGIFAHPRGARFVLIVFGISLVIAAGGHTPLLQLLYKAGVATAIRYPEKFFLMAIFAVTLFGSQMLDRILEGDTAVRDAAAGFALATATVATAVATLGFTSIPLNAWMKAFGLQKNAGTDKMIQIAWWDWKVAAVRGAILVALLLLVSRTRYRTAWLAAGLIFVCADLGPVCRQLNPTMPARFFTEAPAIASKFPPNRADFRVFHEADWYGQEEIARKFFSTGDAVYWIVRNGLFPMTPAGNGIRTVLERDYDKTALLPTIDLVDSVWDVKRSGRTDWWQPFMAMSNAWYRATYRNFEQEKKRVGGDMKRAQPIQFFEGEHYPRYYFADQLIPVKDRKDFVKKLSTNSYSSRVAFVQQGAFVPADGKVHAYRETANDAFLDVESFGRGFLVMSVTPHKYWRIFIDGRRVNSVVTNIGYQGIPVPPGRHRVVMQYRNDMVRIGAVISATAALILIVLAAVRRRQPVAP